MHLMITARDSFNLKRRVFDVKTLIQHAGQAAPQLFAGGGGFVAHDMNGQYCLFGSQCPCMQVMHLDDARKLRHCFADSLKVEPRRTPCMRI